MRTFFRISFSLVLCIFLVFELTGCSTPRPNDIDNVCSIFNQYPKWYWASEKAQRKWGIPESVQMAIIYQESHFNQSAKPPRTHILWIIPWFRPTSALGYSQAVNQTWWLYKRQTGHPLASRTNFYDALNFIGWYTYRAHRKLGIPRNNAYKIYLAYHEGIGGYRRRTYLRKHWLIDVARHVQRRANIYHYQMEHCHLPKKPWWRFWD